jgi:serine/threonine protein phosphatase PrpC
VSEAGAVSQRETARTGRSRPARLTRRTRSGTRLQRVAGVLRAIGGDQYTRAGGAGALARPGLTDPGAGPSARPASVDRPDRRPLLPGQVWGFSAANEPPLLGRPPRVAAYPWCVPASGGYVPDTTLDAAQVRSLSMRAASVRGPEHRFSATVRQDAFAVGRTPDDQWVVAAVCDGVGSAPRSHLGAATAAREAVSRLVTGLSDANMPVEASLQAAVAAASAEVRNVAREESGADVATTLLLLAVATQPGPDGHEYVASSVGDSQLLVLVPAQSLRGLPDDDPSDVHGRPTACLPLPPGSDPIVVRGSLAPGSALLLCTDGFAVPALQPPVAVKLANLWREVPGLAEMLLEVQFLARSYDDDRTVVGVWADPDPEAGRGG